MRPTFATCFTVVMGALAFGCSGGAPAHDQAPAVTLLSTQAVAPPASAPSTVDASGNPPPDYVVTPNGLFHKSCVHKVPNGAQADDSDNVTINGALYHFPPCGYPVLPLIAPAPSVSSTPPDTPPRPSVTLGWSQTSRINPEKALMCWSHY